MTAPYGHPDRRRFAVLAVVMFLILLGGVGAAAWLVHTRTTRPLQQGQRVMEQIRDNPAQHIPKLDRPRWYVGRDGTGKPVGWIRRTRRSTDDGFRGTDDWRLGSTRSAEDWSASRDLSAGEYHVRTEGGEGSINMTATLKDDRVRVVAHRKPSDISAEAPVPGSFLPEWAVEPAARLVARQGEAALFQYVPPVRPRMPEQVEFTGLRMSPLERGKVLLEYRLSTMQQETVYEFGEGGVLLSINLPQIETEFRELKDLGELIRLFPGDVGRFNEFPEMAPLIPAWLRNLLTR